MSPLSRSWGAARGAGPEETVWEYGSGEPGAASGVSLSRSPALPGGSERRPGA